MVRDLFRRLASLFLFALVAVGGGSMPVVDALAFHETTGASDFTAHFEASSGCHADGCSVRTVSNASRFVADLVPTAPVGAPVEFSAPLAPALVATSAITPSTYLSRAPPLQA